LRIAECDRVERWAYSGRLVMLDVTRGTTGRLDGNRGTTGGSVEELVKSRGGHIRGV
jgi:hypothetical protein